MRVDDFKPHTLCYIRLLKASVMIVISNLGLRRTKNQLIVSINIVTASYYNMYIYA